MDLISNAKDAAYAAAFATGYAAHGEEDDSDDAWYATTKREEAVQAALVRCVFGDPIGSIRSLADEFWLTPEVARLAREIDDGHEFDQMPLLGDALEQAGCTDAEILGHCRGPGPHARGCWVMDSILGKS